MDPTTLRLIQGAAGAAGGAGLYVDDVFSTFLYTGTGSTQTITNGIDLAGEGGLVWMKSRTVAQNNWLFDTARGTQFGLISNATFNQLDQGAGFQSFNADGFTLGTGSTGFNGAGENVVSWTFRKAPGFFDVVTYTGTGADQTISHNLGSTPGCIIVKQTSGGGGEWYVYHRSLPTASENWIRLNNSGGANGAIGQNLWGPPTSTTFKVDTYLGLSTSNATYVAYIFAHDEPVFGTGGDESTIKCGSLTISSQATVEVNLGFESQFVLLKHSGSSSNWFLFDTIRGMDVNSFEWLFANSSVAAEVKSYQAVYPTATGFGFNPANNGQFSDGAYIYMAIRRPHKPPTAGTEVFMPIAATSSSGTTRTTGFPIDLQIGNDRSRVALGGSFFNDRLRGVSTNATAVGRNLYSSSTAAETTTALTLGFDNTGFKDAAFYSGYPMCWWNFKRAPGFFDVVAYTGTGSARTVAHSLGVAPELIICKIRDSADHWIAGTQDWTKYLLFSGSNAFSTWSGPWNNTAPTSSVFTVGTAEGTNKSGSNLITYLFATLPGISKVGSYTGTGTTLNIDCGFTAGARFVLIKRTDSTGDWYVWDTARGIVSGNDPYLLLNSTAAEVTNTDYIDPLSSGFTVTSSAPAALNADGGTYLFLAIA